MIISRGEKGSVARRASDWLRPWCHDGGEALVDSGQAASAGV